MSAVNISKENFHHEVLNSDKPVLLDFWASWCGPCRMVLPMVEQIAEEREDIKVFGTDYPTPDGSCVRDYIHVTDLADAHIRALEYLKNGGESDFFNLGNAKGTSVLEVIDSVKRVTGKDFKVTLTDRREGDPAVLVGSAEKAERILGWIPKYAGIDTIVSHAWNWYNKAEY